MAPFAFGILQSSPMPLPIPVDPQSFTSFGVLGALLVVVFILSGILWNVFKDIRSRDKTLMDFVNNHTVQHTSALSSLGDKILSGDRKIAQALTLHASHTRALLVAVEGVQLAQARKQVTGMDLTPDELNRITRSARENIDRRIGTPSE